METGAGAVRWLNKAPCTTPMPSRRPCLRAVHLPPLPASPTSLVFPPLLPHSRPPLSPPSPPLPTLPRSIRPSLTAVHLPVPIPSPSLFCPASLAAVRLPPLTATPPSSLPFPPTHHHSRPPPSPSNLPSQPSAPHLQGVAEKARRRCRHQVVREAGVLRMRCADGWVVADLQQHRADQARQGTAA